MILLDYVSDGSTLHEGSHDEEIMFAIRSYIAENEDALDLVEGEKVYVIGKFYWNLYLPNYLNFVYVYI